MAADLVITVASESQELSAYLDGATQDLELDAGTALDQLKEIKEQVAELEASKADGEGISFAVVNGILTATY